MDAVDYGKRRWAGKSVEERKAHALKMLAARKQSKQVTCPNCQFEFTVGKEKKNGGREVDSRGRREMARDKALQPEDADSPHVSDREGGGDASPIPSQKSGVRRPCGVRHRKFEPNCDWCQLQSKVDSKEKEA